MKHTNIYRVDAYLQIETITVTHVNEKYAIGPSNLRKERAVLKEEIESDTNPPYNGKEVRYFDSQQGAENYIHNTLVRSVEKVHDASDSEIIEMLLTTNMEYLPGEVSNAIIERAKEIQIKLA